MRQANFTPESLAWVYVGRWQTRDMVKAMVSHLTTGPSLLDKINRRYDASLNTRQETVKIRVPKAYEG